MELGLTRVDLLQVGLTSPKTAKLLPSGATYGDKAFQQKVWLCYILAKIKGARILSLDIS